ncbi:MAG: hypothetical protein KC646_11520 [Candidatus Cloacimonetes bacterium]|nr:hypothetical protein [Candidatus Cloacimonadota bacterium]
MHYRYSKYNPKYRNKIGGYELDEWTSISDVGETFDNKKLTMQEYFKVECNHIEFVLSCLKELKIETLYLFAFEEYGGLPIFIDSIEDKTPILVSDLATFLSLIYRECCWGKFYDEDGRLILSFGYDYLSSIYLPEDSKWETIASQYKIYLEDEKVLKSYEVNRTIMELK